MNTNKTNKNSKLLTTDLTTDLNEFIDALEHAFASEGHPDTEVSIGRVERSKRHPDGTYSLCEIFSFVAYIYIFGLDIDIFLYKSIDGY